MSWTLPEALRATGAELVQWGAGPFRGVSTDSRLTGAAEIFVALRGPHYDGHDFVTAAVARGATAAVSAREPVAPPPGVAWLQVGDALRALGDLAAARRRDLAVRVAGVTGSNGKTTTKEMIASVLAASGGKVAKSPGTENNLVGLPRTLLGLAGDERYAVLEMGMNRPGEIWRLAEIARPDVGVITNVGPAHLEGLGSVANVAAAKKELALALGPGATLVVNAADPWLAPVAEDFSGRAILAGGNGPVRALSAETLSDGQRVTIEIDGRRAVVDLRARGAHNVENALLAAATGRAFGLSVEEITAGLAAFVPPAMRLEVVSLPSGARILNDAYNANPASVSAALASLAAEPALRRIAVLGEMWELGAEAGRYHREMGREAAATGVDLLIAVGRYAEEMGAGAEEAGLPASRRRSAGTSAQAGDLLAAELGQGDVVLIKGSRAARMEEIVRVLGGRS
jgi:UDP-N-acetylmuramoyl-tripeptide--D-alanyl-D-alanine ligase